jgi:ATP phosphoribosyltransferase regulatory subunit HisZ
LTSEERRAIEEAAEAEGYSEGFTNLLCRFAELIGTDEVLRELERIDSESSDSRE